MSENTSEHSPDENLVPASDQVERWCRATDRLISPAANAGHDARRAAFARVMHEALGSLLLNGCADSPRTQNDTRDKSE
jgi:hypothetical protein